MIFRSVLMSAKHGSRVLRGLLLNAKGGGR
jgi:hypothetical protein